MNVICPNLNALSAAFPSFCDCCASSKVFRTPKSGCHRDCWRRTVTRHVSPHQSEQTLMCRGHPYCGLHSFSEATMQFINLQMNFEQKRQQRKHALQQYYTILSEMEKEQDFNITNIQYNTVVQWIT